MKKTYFILLFVNLTLTAIFMIPSFAVMAALFTFGIAFVVEVGVLIASIILLSMLPSVLLWDIKILRWVGVALTIILPVYFIAGPHFKGLAQADEILSNAHQHPAQAITGRLPKSIEIIRTSGPNADLQDRVFERELCDKTCQSLLLGGEIEWLRVRLTDDAFGNDRANTTSVFALAQDPECRALYTPAPDDAPCIIFRDDHFGDADLVIEIEENQWINSWGDGDFGYVKPRGKRVVTATLWPGDNAQVGFSRTQLFARYPDYLFFFAFDNWGQKGGFERKYLSKRNDAISITDELENLGLTLAAPYQRTQPLDSQKPWQVPQDMWQTILAASLLATDPVGDDYRHKFANAKFAVIGNWLSYVNRNNSLTPEERDLACAIKADQRMANTFRLRDLENKHGPLDCL